jgi:ABC-2 type transport system permease protein
VPAGCVFLLYMMVMSATPVLLNTVLEEKMQKISEVLLSAVTPFQLMMGKLLGATMVSFTLSALYLGCISGMLWKMGVLNLVPPTLIPWFVFFQLLSLLIFGSIFLAIGSVCSEIRDAQSFMFPVMMLVMLPFFVFMPIMQSPGSSFARWFSLFPPATPMLLLLRIAIPPGPPWWEIALGVALTTLFMFGCVWAGAKIFRIGILAQGQAPSFGKLLAWIFSK